MGGRVAGKIFVNYRRDDAKAEAARLHDRLALSFGAAGVFMDVDNLLAGERFDLKLREALQETDVFLAVIGARWLSLLEARAASGERDYVREEIAAALAAKLVVIPVLMDRAALPKGASLPEDIRELALYHKHDVVYESFGRDVQALIAAIETHRRARDTQAAEAARIAQKRKSAKSAQSAIEKARVEGGEGENRGYSEGSWKLGGDWVRSGRDLLLPNLGRKSGPPGHAGITIGSSTDGTSKRCRCACEEKRRRSLRCHSSD